MAAKSKSNRFALIAVVVVAIGAIIFFAVRPGAEPVAVSESTIIVDVRTPAEYAEGHLEGAELFDLNGGDLAAAIPTMDPNAEYVVYCKSGNRSSQAVKLMLDAGFTNVTDLGSMSQAESATGLPVVR